MSIALVGLLLLQFYWIRNVHQLHEERFKSEVHEVVESAVSSIENIERNILCKASNSISNHLMLGNNCFTIDEKVEGYQSITIHDTIIKNKNDQLDYLVISGITVDSITGTSAEHRVITQNYANIFEYDVEKTGLKPQDSTLNSPIKVTNDFDRGLMKRSKYINDLMLEMFTSNVFDDITLRLNPKILDTLISNRLKQNKIDTLFNFRVKDADGNTVEFVDTPNNYKINMDESEFRYKLYPSDLVSKKYFVELEFPHIKSYMLKQMFGTLVAALFLVLMVMFAFYFAVSTIFKQKKVSEIKNDFISNMTHELKTPISTISLACEAIGDPDIKNDETTLLSFISMIASENKRLGNLVEKVLQTSLLEKGKLNLQKAEYPIHDLVKDAVKSFEIQFQQKGGGLQLKRLDSVKWKVDKIHFSNVLFNLMDNALKYSTTNPITKVELVKETKGFSISITDNGIGISKENQKRIFDKLYRVSTGDVHDVKGFGLGLDYVSSIVEMHGGIIRVKSEIDKGTTFKITFKDE